MYLTCYQTMDSRLVSIIVSFLLCFDGINIRPTTDQFRERGRDSSLYSTFRSACQYCILQFSSSDRVISGQKHGGYVFALTERTLLVLLLSSSVSQVILLLFLPSVCVRGCVSVCLGVCVCGPVTANELVLPKYPSNALCFCSLIHQNNYPPL